MNLLMEMELDVSNLTTKDFMDLAKAGDGEKFQSLLSKLGLKSSAIHTICRMKEAQIKKAIDSVLSIKKKSFAPFVYGSSETAIQSNENSELIKWVKKCSKENDINQVIFSVLLPIAKSWVGEELWSTAPLHFGETDWVIKLASVCGFLEDTRTLKAELTPIDSLKIGDILYLQLKSGDKTRGIILSGEYRKNNNGYVYGSLQVLLPTHKSQTTYLGIERDNLISREKWLAQNPLLEKLIRRPVASIYGDQFYRVGRTDQLDAQKTKDEDVQEALCRLTTPDTPEELWEIYKGAGRANWLMHYHHEIWHKSMSFHMVKYGIDDVKRVMKNSSCKPPKRGSRYDRLPSDKMLSPLIQDLVSASTVEEVESALTHYWWVEKHQWASGSYSICCIDRDCSCYDKLYKTGLAQSTDVKFIVSVLQVMSTNACNFACRIADWSPESGLVELPPADGFTMPYREEKLAILKNGVFLGVHDMNRGGTTVSAEEENLEDEEEFEEDEFEDEECA